MTLRTAVETGFKGSRRRWGLSRLSAGLISVLNSFSSKDQTLACVKCGEDIPHISHYAKVPIARKFPWLRVCALTRGGGDWLRTCRDDRSELGIGKGLLHTKTKIELRSGYDYRFSRRTIMLSSGRMLYQTYPLPEAVFLCLIT